MGATRDTAYAEAVAAVADHPTTKVRFNVAVALGRMNGLEAQIVDGLTEGDVVVLYPSELIGEGTPVEAR